MPSRFKRFFGFALALILVVASLWAAWMHSVVIPAYKIAASKPYGVRFSLLSQYGQPITEDAFKGRPSALFFGYTHCPDVCPTTLFELDGWLQKVDPDGTKLRAYFVTIDPSRDTPEIMNEYVSNVSKRITGISGPRGEVEAMARGFGVFFNRVPTDPKEPSGDYTMDHTASVFLLDREGKLSGTLPYEVDTEIALKKLARLASDQ